MTAQGTGAQQDGQKRVDLVCEGGGVKGIALVGAMAVLEEHGYQIQRLAGTSAGAVVTGLYAAGYTAADIREMITSQDFTRFTDATILDRIPLIGQSLNILLEKGIYQGNYFLGWMRDRLQARGIRTFENLRADPPSDDPRYKYRLQVIASDTTQHCLLVLPKDAAQLGIENADELEVALAVRMSMSIPLFFEPVQFANARTGQKDLIVDGGILSNFPVWLFDSDGPPRWPTFGLKLVESDPKTPLRGVPPTGPIHQTIDYFTSLISTMQEAHDRLYLEMDQFVRTIAIPTLGIGSTQFTLTREQSDALYQSGRNAAESFLKGWDDAGGFPAYVAAFRSGAPQPTRREHVLERMRSASRAQTP